MTAKGGLPTRFTIEDGSAHDRTLNGDVIARIAEQIAANRLPAIIAYVADSAMVNQKNLELLGETPLITRLPAAYSECSRVIQAAVNADEWVELGVLSKSSSSPNRPPASYKACDLRVNLYGKSYRATVVHSSAHDRRRTTRMKRQIAADKQSSKHKSQLCRSRRSFVNRMRP